MVITYASRSGLPLFPQVRPMQLAGIEINPYAQELAQVVVWIGFLQSKHHNGFTAPRNLVLEAIQTIRRMDAILDLSIPAYLQLAKAPTARCACQTDADAGN